MEFTHDYLALQTLRFDRKFSFNESISLNIDEHVLPPFVIQPLIENAFRHAVEKTEMHVDIDLRVFMDEDRLTIQVNNTMPEDMANQANASMATSLGTGLDNLKSRLRYIYSDDFTCKTVEEVTSFAVVISLPEKLSVRESDASETFSV